MGIYIAKGYTLMRATTRQGLAVSITKDGTLKAAVCAPRIEPTLDALRYALEQAQRRVPTVDVVSGLTVRVLDGADVMRVRVTDWATPIAAVDADHLELAGRLLSGADPSSTYTPVRRVVVRAGDVYVRHHIKTLGRARAERDQAFQAIYNHLADSAAVELLTQGERE